MCLEAVDRACELVTLLDAGEVVSGYIDIYPTKKEVCKIPFEPKRINDFLGIYVSPNDMREMLEKLFFTFDGDDLVVPSFRDDVRCMNDIAEEVVRMYGYNKVEASRIVAQLVPGGLTPLQQFRRKINSLLCGLGYDEICTYSFMSSKLYTKAGWKEGDEATKSVEISNPFGEDTKTMRTSALPTMLEVLETNTTRSVPSARLFELAKVFIPREGVVTNIHGLEGTLPDERQKLVLGAYGQGIDFYSIKGTIETILECAGISNVKYVSNKEFTVMHPGRCADVYVNGQKLGTFGELHPTSAKNYTFSSKVYLAELDFETLFNNIQKSEKYNQLPKYPAITRDFSFVCKEDTAAGDLADTIKSCEKTLIEKIVLFDVFRGGQIPEGMKSLSFSVTLRAKDHTLTVEEADKISKKILSAASFKHGAEIRS
jgi:phenylalanyl-tRNA synthetase beta chain